MKAMVYDKKVIIAFTCFLLMPCLVVIFGRNKQADVNYLCQPYGRIERVFLAIKKPCSVT